MKATISITLVVDPAPITAPPTDDLGPVGTKVDGQSLPISGGTPPYTVTNGSGTLPPGITVNQDGTLSGTATQAGQFPVTFDVADSLG